MKEYKTVKEMRLTVESEVLTDSLNQAKRIIKKLWDYKSRLKQAEDILKWYAQCCHITHGDIYFGEPDIMEVEKDEKAREYFKEQK